MNKENYDKSGGGNHFLTGYGWQVLVVPLLAAILLFLFFWFFGYDTNLLWANVLVLAIWLLLVLFAFRHRPHGEVWRDYRWIIAPAVLILLFLFDTSWAQSALSTSSVKKNDIKVTSLDTFQIHAEYPLRIPFDDAEPSEIRLWVTGIVNCIELEVSAEGLLFAVKPPPDASLEWSNKLTLKFDKTTTAMTLLVKPSKSPETDSQSVQLNLVYGGKKLETQDWKIIIESKRDSQIRGWKKNFLDTGSTIISLIVAVYAGIKQLEEEKKRQRAERIKQAIVTYDTDARNDFSKTLQEHQNLSADWNEWDRALQEQFRKTYASFVEEKIWDTLATTTEVVDAVGRLLQLCERMFENKEEKPVSILKQLQSALRQDADSPLALLVMLKENPASIGITRQIAASIPPELKKKTIDKYVSEFPNQVRDLRTDLGFPDTESFPLKRQLAFHAKPHNSEDRLTAWLKSHELECSPFADMNSPFYSILDDQLLVDIVSPGFVFPALDLQNLTFEVANTWDTGAALLAYCQSLKSALKIKEETFFVLVNPGLVVKHDAVNPHKLYLHALAEQWLWSLAETPTLFYSLKGEQRDLTGRLLRWHDLSPSITAYKIAQFAGRIQEGERKNQTALLSKITEWLKDMDATDLRVEEVNALIELRPSSKQNALFLIPTVDLNPRVKLQILPDLYKRLAEQSDWISAHNCWVVGFTTGAKSPQTVSPSSLVNQCNARVQKCSNNKLEFNQLFDAPGEEPDAILAQKASGSPGKMVILGQNLLLQHAAKPSPEDYLQIEDLIALEA